MLALYRPKILLISGEGGEYLEKLLSGNGLLSFFRANTIEDAKNHLDQVNIDFIVAIMDKKNNEFPSLIQKLSPSIPIIVVENGDSGMVPQQWREISDIFLRKKTAQDSLVKIFFDLLEQRKSSKKAA